jgi:excinuclease ABC subunit C
MGKTLSKDSAAPVSQPLNALKRQAREAPLEAGVYIMKDADSRIIYVGKAKVLRNRLSSYFAGEKDIKTSILLKHAVSIETIITADEYEALLLENTLIKQHSPRYNLKLTDGKTYPVIRLSTAPFSRVFRTRHIVEDGSAYFGPFPNVSAVDELLEIINRNFSLRKCRRLRKRADPCMYYHIGRCAAPCCGKITEDGYAVQVERVRKLLSGETGPLLAELTGEMREEAAALRFERAARLRNAIRSVEGLTPVSAVVDFDPQGRDYIAWAAEGMLSVWSVFSMRGGKLTGRELFRSRSASSDEETLETFIASYYNAASPPPPRIFVWDSAKNREEAERQPFAPVSANLKRWFSETFSLEPELTACAGAETERAEKHHSAVILMVRQNAEEELRRWLKERGAGPALDELTAALSLRARPQTIEGFDIAQLDGKHPVASLVSFKNGVPDS